MDEQGSDHNNGALLGPRSALIASPGEEILDKESTQTTESDLGLDAADKLIAVFWYFMLASSSCYIVW